MTQAIPLSDDYLIYIGGLGKLHALIADGDDEGAEGDSVRDEMDQPWYGMSDIERARLRSLSGDLYSLTDPPHQVREMNPQAEGKLDEAQRAMEAADWDLALNLLRRWGGFLSPGRLAATRGRIWLGSGDADTAVLFLARASELEPSNLEYLRAYLGAVSLSKEAAVPSIVKEILPRLEEFPPQIVIQAVDILFFKPEAGSRIEDPAFLDRVIPLLENAVLRLPRTATGQPAGLLMATGMLGFAHDLLGHSEEALKYYDEFLKLDPHNDIAYVSRAMLQLNSNRPAAIEDARRAVHYNSANFQPYLILIDDAITGRRFGEVIHLCHQVLTLDLPDDVRGALLEGEAIAQAELKQPESEVQTTFERAQQLLPGDLRLQHNVAQFKEHSVDLAPIAWQIPPMTDLIRPHPPRRLAA